VNDTLLAIAGDVPELRIRIVNGAGAVIQQICRQTDALPFSAAESALANVLGEAEPIMSSAQVGRLFTGADGSLWAQRNRAVGPLLADYWFGPLGATFDVFSPKGDYLGELVAPDDTRIVAARGDTVLALRYGKGRGVSVVAYRLRHEPDATGRID
jgi:hypothetical protein